MMLSKRLRQYLRQYLLAVVIVSLSGFACSTGLKDYTQIELKVLSAETGVNLDASNAEDAAKEVVAEGAEPDTGKAEPEEEEVEKEASEKEASETGDVEAEAAIAQMLSDVDSAIEKRLLSLGLETAEVTTQAPDQVIVRLPDEIAPESVVENITQPNRLTLRSQKADTEDDLASNIETLQRLLVEQNNLKQTDNLAEAEALQPKIDETRAAMLNLFEPGEITGDMLLDAQAVQMSGFNVWEVRIWFDSQGTEKFAEKTKALAGTGRAIGLFLDDVLLSAPTVNVSYADEGITGGASTISGNFTAEAAKELEQQLKNGALPSDLEVVSITSSDTPSEDPSEDQVEAD